MFGRYRLSRLRLALAYCQSKFNLIQLPQILSLTLLQNIGNQFTAAFIKY